jgi:hypothetical protein
MSDVQISDAAYNRIVHDTSVEALEIVASRIVEDARPLVRERPAWSRPSRAQAYYSQRGALRTSIDHDVSEDSQGVVANIRAQSALGKFRNIGGRGRPASGTRGINPVLLIAAEMQRDRPVAK